MSVRHFVGTKNRSVLEPGGVPQSGRPRLAETGQKLPPSIKDVLDLGMWLDVNGVRRQTGNTSTMVFDPYTIVHYLSQFLVLEPGDLIDTGTPPGVGMGFDPPAQLLRSPWMPARSNLARNQAEWPGFCSLVDPYSLRSKPFTPVIERLEIARLIVAWSFTGSPPPPASCQDM